MNTSQQNNAPIAGQGDEGDDQNQEGTIMTIIADAPHARYSIEVGADLSRPVYYGENVLGTQLLRMHFRLARITARPGVYEVRHFQGATAEDRRRALNRLRGMRSPEETFARWKACGVDVARSRWASDRRSWMEFVFMGDPVEDPLIQLELEMMIDLTDGVAA